MRYFRFCLIVSTALSLLIANTITSIIPAIGGERGKDLGEELLRMSKEQNVDIEFYGLVKDQNGDPVVGAEVEMGRGYFMLGRDKHTATTNSKGRFEIIGVKGTYLTIRNISKKGYEFQRTDQNIRIFDFWHGIPNKRFVSSPHEPIVFAIRKKDKAIFLMRGEMSKKLKDKDVYAIDLVRGKMFGMNDNEYYENVRISTTREGSSYRLGFHAIGPNSGIVLLETAIYTAPTSGYEREEYIQLDVGSGDDIYLVTRTTSGLYARLDVNLTVHDDNTICRINSYVNPYGSVELEYDSYLPVEDMVRMRKEAKSSLMTGKIPVLPERYSDQ